MRVKSKKMGRQRRGKKGNKVEERKDKIKEAPAEQTMGLEWQRGGLMYCDAFFFYFKGM